MLPHRAGDRPYQRASRMFGCSLPDGQSVLSKELILLNDTSPRQTAHPPTDRRIANGPENSALFGEE